MGLFGPPSRGDRIARRLVLPLLFVLGLLLTVFWVAYTPLSVDGESMLPGLHHGDRVLVTRGYTKPSRGDVVYIEGFGPRDKVERQFIKRVIAIPGDTVRLVSGRAVVNGVPADVTENLIFSGDDVWDGETIIPPGYVYVLGDNRPVSLDSRFFGPVPLEAVSGRVVFRYTPVTRLGMVD